MSKKKRLLDLLQFAGDAERAFASVMGERVRDETGTADSWAPKDELAHVAAWKRITAELIRAGLEGKTFQFHDDLDQKNEELYQQSAAMPWGSVVEGLATDTETLVEQVTAASEAELVDADRFPWLDGRSFWSRALHNGFYHAAWHLALMYAGRGERERGHSLMEEVTREMVSLLEGKRWQDQYQYNQACYYALAGDKERAIEQLGVCLTESAELREWSRQDSDLASIWEEPAYLTLLDG
jgi:hypothetical protein